MNNIATLHIDKNVVIKNVLRILDPKWNHVEIIIKESKNLSTLKYDKFISSLMLHEERLKELQVGGFEEKAFFTKENEASGSGKGRGQNSYSGRGKRGR